MRAPLRLPLSVLLMWGERAAGREESFDFCEFSGGDAGRLALGLSKVEFSVSAEIDKDWTIKRDLLPCPDQAFRPFVVNFGRINVAGKSFAGVAAD